MLVLDHQGIVVVTPHLVLVVFIASIHVHLATYFVALSSVDACVVVVDFDVTEERRLERTVGHKSRFQDFTTSYRHRPQANLGKSGYRCVCQDAGLTSQASICLESNVCKIETVV